MTNKVRIKGTEIRTIEARVSSKAPRPDEPTLQLLRRGWRVFGGTFTSPVQITCIHAYKLATEMSPEAAQEVLDETRQFCGQLRKWALNERDAKKHKALQRDHEKLRGQLGVAQEFKVRTHGSVIGA